MDGQRYTKKYINVCHAKVSIGRQTVLPEMKSDMLS